VLLVALLGAPALGGGQRVSGCHGAEKILARVGDGFLTEADLCQVIARQLAALELQKYRLRKTTLERLIDRRLLALEAQARSLLPEELRNQLEQQVTVTPQEVQSFYEANFHRFADLDEARARKSIREFLADGKRTKALRDFLAELQERYAVAVFPELPPGREVDQPEVGTTLTGDPSSPVVVTVFVDLTLRRRIQPTRRPPSFPQPAARGGTDSGSHWADPDDFIVTMYYPDPAVTLNCPSWRYCTAVQSEPMFPNLWEDDWGLLWDPSDPEQNRLVNASIALEVVGGSFRYDDCETACRYAPNSPCCVFYCH
jgi:hypothetical protein